MKITLTNFSYPKLFLLGLLTTLLFVGNSIRLEAQTTININTTGTTGSYITGSVNATGVKNDGDMTNLNSTLNRGWATFDLSSIPINALITDVKLKFTTTSASISSSITNFIYGFNGNPASMTGASLYIACGSGTALDASTWSAGALNTKVLGAAGLSFIQTNIGQSQVNLSFVRGSSNIYHIYGYGAITSQQPQLSITYVLQSNCTGTPNPGTTLSSVGSVCPGSTIDLSLQNSFVGQYGISYQWQTSINGTTYTNSLNDTLPTLSITQNSTTYYQCIVGCGFTSNSATSNAIQVSLNGPTSCYCASTATFTGDEEIVGVQFGALNNISNCSSTAPGAGSTNQLYSNYTTLTPVNFTKGLTYNLDITINTCGPFGSFYGEDIAVFIDYNQDGDYLDIGENVYTSPYATGTAGAVRSSSIIIPCDALSGNTGMRVVYTEGGGSTSCGSYGAGETEDYLINIIDNPLTYVSSTAAQQTGVVAPGSFDREILRVPATMAGCGVATATNFAFNTAGSTNVGNIANAKLYRTGNSKTFSTSKLLASIANPSGSFVFSVIDTLLNNDTTNYWLAYDINAGATLANAVDARLDSIEIFGANRIPAISNPAGNVVINSPMTFVSANATQSLLSRLEAGSTNNRVLGMEVVTSVTGASINLTQFDLSANGTTDTSNIKNIKVWYTGNSSTFSTTTQFGSTLASLPSSSAFSITGTQGLNNGTNYFWLTYDVTSSAAVGNVIDAEFISTTVYGTPQIPATSSPFGSRQIRAPYCVSSANFAFDEEIYRVQFGALNNTSDCSTIAPGNGSVNQLYSNYTTLAPVTFTKGLTYNLGVTINTCGGFWGENVAVFIDYNQDGDFLDAGENIYTSPLLTGTANAVRGSSVTIPCNASLGETRMRVVYAENGGAASCGTYDYGETEDYLINITDNPLTYVSSTAFQQTGLVSPGALDREILRIPVTMAGCGVATATSFVFNTAGSTNVGNIANAKLYRTGNSKTFSTSKLLASIANPSGSFVFSVIDTLLNNDTTNYWLAYDINAGATLTNAIDARLDSIEIFGAYRTPIISNPAGNVIINSPMFFISANATQSLLSKVEAGSINNRILGMEVFTSATGASINLTQIDLSANGTTDTSNIKNIKVWYTGNSSTFSTATQFGSTLASIPAAATYSITGNQGLNNGTNYFWLTYDVSSSATVGNAIDAEFISATVSGSPQNPAISAPAGSRQIRAPYCVSTATNTGDEEIFGVQFGALNNTSDCSSIAPGAGSTNQLYSNYTTLAPVNFTKGLTYNLGVTINTCGGFGGENVAVYIDYNQDGDFLDAGENIYTSPFANGTAGAIKGGLVTIPCNASAGETRMRVVYTEGGGSSSCATYGWGETEDYLINIIDNPLTYLNTTAIQQTGVVSPGALDRPILNVPIAMTGCGVAKVTTFNFNTAGSTNVGDIANAKLYRTDNNQPFSTTKLIASIANPSGSFSFSVNDTLLNNDTTNYWLAYDINAGAALSNVVDAVYDSVEVFGANRIPFKSNPIGNVVINSPMTFVSANATQSLLSKVEAGSINNRILGMEVVTSATGASINLTQFDLSTNGTTDTSNIKNIKVWYTGNSSTFSTTTQFGSTLASLPSAAAFSIAGTQGLNNGTNYFWLTYDVTSSATLGNVIDAEFISATVSGTLQTPATSAPSGSRQIRAPYCVSSANFAFDEEIFGVQLGALNNTSDCSTIAPGAGSVNQLYSNYTTLTAITYTKGNSYNLGVTINTCGSFYGENVAVFIDYNQDGDFLDVGENIYTSPFSTGTANLVLGGNITIPCNASLGETRMRVVYVENGGATSCGTYDYGETEDYIINIADNPLAYIGSGVSQPTAAVAPGTSDVSILRIPLKASGCGVGLVTEFNFNTIGTTNVANISSAKLYATGNSNSFSTGKLLSTILSPSGQFSFTGLNDTLLTGQSDTNNYWLAYDVAAGATLGNLLDARVDSINVLGQYRVPSNNNPIGARTIDAPMTYVSSTTTQTATTKVERSSTDNQIIGLQVVTSAIGSPIILSNLDISTSGTSSLSDISNLKVWYTGNSNAFASTTQFGSTVAAPTATQSVSGSTNLANGTNYFWVTYDIAASATIGNIVDAEISSLTVNGTSQTPSVTAPAGSRAIKSNYVSPTYANGTQFGIYLSNVQLGSINNTTTGSPAPYVTFYDNLSTTINCGSSNTLLVTPGTFAGNNIAAWIDFNNDGIYASTEKLGEFINVGAAPSSATFNFFAPINASLGATRMRVISAYNVTNISPSGSFTYGETEDYVINILPAAAAASVYSWNQTVSGDFAVASNWTPNRTNPSLTDKLIFSTGGNITITNLSNQIISSVTVNNNTNVTLSAVSNAVFGGYDSLNLTSGKLIAGSNVIFSVGIDTISVGILTGTGSVEGVLRRWVKSGNNSIRFPLSSGANSRSANFTYTTSPSTSGMLAGQFVTTVPSSFGLPLTEGSIVLKLAAINGYWNFIASNGLNGGTYNATLAAQGFTGVQDYTTLVMLKRFSTVNQWTLEGTHVTTTGSNNAPILSRTGLAGYGNFGVGGDTLFNTLPVTLVSLSAKNMNGDAVISWTTSTEINNKGFEIERSFNGKTFSKINFVKGAVNSSVLHNYVVSDNNVFANNNASLVYYRLKQVDLNGKYTYSDVVSVSTDVKDAEDNIKSFPNPFNSDININITAKAENTVHINIFDIRGQLVHSSSFVANQGEGIYKVENLDGLAGGIYFVRVESNGEVKTIKMTKLN